MPKSQNDISNTRAFPDVRKEAITDEDEINLIDYFKVIWKWKYLILPGSVLPVFIVGLILFFSPRNYKITYVYDVGGRSVYDMRVWSGYDTRNRSYDVSNWNLDKKNYNVLLDRFYSEENLNKITNKLRENSLNKYAKLINGGRECLKEFVYFDVWPPFPDLSKTKTTEAHQLERVKRLSAQLLNMTIVARPKNDISKISSVIRDNLENVIPVSMIEEYINADIKAFRAQIVGIEEEGFDLEIYLKTNKAILAKLKNIKAPVLDKSVSSIALQFDVSEKTEYLPVEYQIQAAESKIIHIEGQVATNEKSRVYYRDLLALSEKLLAGLKNKMFSYYTIQQFHSFLTGLADDYKKNEEIQSYLNSYIKRIKNRISASEPVTRKPSISVVAKDTVKKSGTVFTISVMLSLLAAFLLEGIQKSQVRASTPED